MKKLKISRLTPDSRYLQTVALNTLKNGGLNLTDLETQIKAIRLSWISRIIDERVGPWKSYFTFHLKKYGGTLLLKCNYDVRDLNLSLNGFYQQTVT